MWVFTREGFFSIAATKYCKPGELAVRARKREHLEGFMARHAIKADILSLPEADYRYRIQIPRETFMDALREEAGAVDYNSFIDASTNAGSSADYLRSLFDTWAAINRIQGEKLPDEL